MIYEFIATITAGFGMAGIAIVIRHLSKLMGKTTPKWLIPVFAGIGMLGFQIYQEYHWQEQQITQLPESAKVVKVIEDKTWYRPWSYIKPQVVRFMAVDAGKPLPADVNGSTDVIKQVNLYLVERRISTKIVPQLINCTQPSIANIANMQATNPDQTATSEQQNIQNESVTNKASDANLTTQGARFENLVWEPLKANDELIIATCS